MSTRLRPLGQITTAAMRPLFDALRTGGRDPGGLVRSAGADPGAFEAGGVRWLPAWTTDRIWQTAARGYADLPLRVASAVGPSSFGLLSYLAASCDTVGEALATLTTYYGVLSESTTYRLEASGGGATLVSIDLHGPRPTSVESFAVMVSLGFIRGQALGPVEVREVRLTQARPDEGLVEAHERAFGARLRFGCAGAGYVLGAGVLGLRMRGAEPGLRTLLEESAERALAAPPSRTLAERVREQIVARGAGCSVRAVDVAADLGMSERTLRRLLGAEGTSFRDELDAVLAGVASERLGGDSVEGVAASLGFADAATFRRAFRRWRGAAPRAKVGRDAPT